MISGLLKCLWLHSFSFSAVWTINKIHVPVLDQAKDPWNIPVSCLQTKHL